MSGARRRVAVQISGRGSNLQALIEAAADPDYPAEIVLVISDNEEAQGLARAEEAGIARVFVRHGGRGGRAAFEAELEAKLRDAGTDLICNAGFMRILSPDFVARWEGRLLNIHPSLLPSFPGLDTHRRALEAGVKLHGCSVHFVDAGIDSGPIIGQAAVPVLPGDDEESLAARVLTAEHRLYPRCLALVCRGEACLEGQSVRLAAGVAAGDEAVFNPQKP